MNDIETVLAVVVLSTLTWLVCDWLWEHGIRIWRRRQVRHILKECRHVDFDPAAPRLVPPSPQTPRPENVHPVASHADRVSAIGDSQASGYLTTNLRRVK